MDVRIAIEPAEVGTAFSAPGVDARQEMTEAVIAAGAEVVSIDSANAMVWMDPRNADPLSPLLNQHPHIKWVQLPYAGVEAFAGTGLFSRDVAFTCAKGAYGGQVGEHAFALLLACYRNVTEASRFGKWHPTEVEGVEGKRITVLGAGGIAGTFIRYAKAGLASVTVLRKHVSEVPGADQVLPISDLHAVLPDTDVLVLALSLTPETRGIIGAKELSLLPAGATLINVARGGHVDTEALVTALQSGRLRGAGLDVTDPEPLPDGHPLWGMDNVVITSHSADSTAYRSERLARRTAENVVALREGNPLIGRVDAGNGY